MQHEIPIIVDREIILGHQGEKYAMAAWKGSMVTWYCKYPFAIQFAPSAQFKRGMIEKKLKAKLAEKKFATWTVQIPRTKLNQFMYKYTISVYANGKILILDPVLVPIPPKN